MRTPRGRQVHAQHLLRGLDKVHFLNEASNRLLSCNSVSSSSATYKSRPLMSFPSVVDFARDRREICLNAFFAKALIPIIPEEDYALYQIGYCYTVFFSNFTPGTWVSCCAQTENTTKGRQGNKKKQLAGSSHFGTKRVHTVPTFGRFLL